MKDIVEKWSNIAVSYTGKLEDWTVFDATSNRGWSPLEFKAWAGQMISWFDAWVLGMKLWETKVINISALEAYGEYDETKKQVLAKKDLVSFTAAWFKLEKWEKLPTQMGEFEIIEVDEESVIIDTNHALAWKNLTFEITIEKIK
jgi:peptidylprolyl isomerase